MPEMAEQTVQVAVRVRPFNSREKNRNAQGIVSMVDGQTTLLFDPDNPRDPPKKFTFDHSYWSHDGFQETDEGVAVADHHHPNGDKYADQVFLLFLFLWLFLLQNLWGT